MGIHVKENKGFQRLRFLKVMPTHPTIIISVTPELQDDIAALAKAACLPLVTYARMILAQHAATHRPAPLEIRSVEPVIPQLPGLTR